MKKWLLYHQGYFCPRFSTTIGPVQPYVLADLYKWLEAHSGLSHPFATTAATNHTVANMTSLSTNTTSNSTSSGK